MNIKSYKDFIYNNIYLKFLPREIVEYIELKRKINYYRRKKIIFVHVPKAAGTSVSYALYGRTLGHFKARFIKKHYPTEFNELFSFAIVRNPYDRVYSAYKFVKQRGTEIMGIYYKSIYDSDLFENFENFVKKWLVNVDLSKEDYVFQPQYLFTHDKNDTRLVKKIWKLENMQIFEKEFVDYTGFNITLSHLNRSIKENRLVLSNELKEIIYNVYEKDFKLLGYEK